MFGVLIMIWLEMSRDKEHGGGNWSFTKCLWAPTHKRGENKGKWPYWENLLQVKAGDMVLHLRGKDSEASFTGYSIAEIDGYETTMRPPKPGPWGYSTSFYRVPLKDFTEFQEKVYLRELFKKKEDQLRYYFNINRNRSKKEKRYLFYVIQGGNLQCQNGGYLSEVDNQLLDIILGANTYPTSVREKKDITPNVVVGESTQQFRTRIGQKEFSDRVRINYDSVCCFPGCDIRDERFLVGSHIARWADAPDLRGEVSNGLCLCLMHDKAFELGYFTINQNLEVTVNRAKAVTSAWIMKNVLPYERQGIKLSEIKPSKEAIQLHWERIGFKP